MKRLYCLPIAALLGLAAPVGAYVDATPSLGRLAHEAAFISVLEVAKVHHEKRILIYRKRADLKGRLESEEMRHVISDGLHPREPRTILAWAEPGKTAVCFGNGKVVQVCLGRYWYECAAGQPPWWTMTRGRPELSLAYHGPAVGLRRHVAQMLAGKETIIPAVLHGVTSWQGYEAVAFKHSLRGREVPVGRLRASLAMPSSSGEVMGDPRYLVSYEAGGPEDVPPLVAALHGRSAAERAEAAESLGLLGRQARAGLPALEKALADPDRQTRIRAAGALLRIQPPNDKAVAVLLRGGSDPEAAVRRAALETLGEVGPTARAAVPALIAALEDPDPGIRWAAAEALGSFGAHARAAVGPLQAALGDPALKQMAADTLGRLGSPALTAVPALTALCKDADANLRLSAATAIMRILTGKKEHGEAIRAAVPVFVEAIGHGDAGRRWQGVWCVKWLGPKAKSAIPALLELARTGEGGSRVAALEALGFIGPEARAAAAAVRDRLEDPQWEVRLMAAEALWRIEEDTQTAVQTATAALKEGDRPARLAGAVLLREMGPEAGAAGAALVDALADDDRSVRWTAVSAVENLGPEVKVKMAQLARCLDGGDPHVAARVARILGKLGSAARRVAPALVKALAAEDLQVRMAAAEAVVEVAPDTAEVVPVLIALLDRSSLRGRAIAALRKLGPRASSAVAALTPLLQDASPERRKAAAEALRSIRPPRPEKTGEKAKTKAATTSGEEPGERIPTTPAHQLAWVVLGGASIVILGGASSYRRRRRSARSFPDKGA